MVTKKKNIEENQTDKMIRHYLRRRIAKQHSELSKKMYHKGRELGGGYTEVFKAFANPFSSGPEYTDELIDIFEHKKRTGNSFSVYNYFDIPTLNAYFKYLYKLNTEIKISRADDDKRYIYLEKDFKKAYENTCNWLIDNAHREETGFYNPDRSIGLLIFNGKLSPGRTMPEDEFRAKYDDKECMEALNEYLEIRFKGKNNYDFCYNKEGFFIDGVQHYLDIDSNPITYINASNQRKLLMGYFDASNNPFDGDVYDFEGNIVEEEGRAGVAIYDKYPRVTKKPEESCM